MKLEEARENYYTYTGKLSDINRQLSFAGIAIIWLLATDRDIGAYQLVNCFWWPLLFFVLSLSFDLLHYVSSSLCWGIFHRYKEKRIIINRDINIEAPICINWPGIVCIFLKVFFAIGGYGFLVIHILGA